MTGICEWRLRSASQVTRLTVSEHVPIVLNRLFEARLLLDIVDKDESHRGHGLGGGGMRAATGYEKVSQASPCSSSAVLHGVKFRENALRRKCSARPIDWQKCVCLNVAFLSETPRPGKLMPDYPPIALQGTRSRWTWASSLVLAGTAGAQPLTFRLSCARKRASRAASSSPPPGALLSQG
jgi:hypothetical protein